MAPQLSQEMRTAIIMLITMGYKITDISKQTGVSRKTVYLWVKRWRESGDITPLHRKIYDRATTPLIDAAIIADHTANPGLSTKATSNKYGISMDTVRRRLKEAAIKLEEDEPYVLKDQVLDKKQGQTTTSRLKKDVPHHNIQCQNEVKAERKKIKKNKSTGKKHNTRGKIDEINNGKSNCKDIPSATHKSIQIEIEYESDVKPSKISENTADVWNSFESEASSAFESINTAEVPLISDTDDTVSAPPVKSPVVPERHVCVSCEKSFDGFVYECVQCEYRMCSKCDQEGVHSEHYVLRIPADRSKEEVIMVLEKVRQAIEPLELHPPARAKRKRKKIPQASQSETESDSDDDVAAEPTVEVKLEVESDEDDPLSSLVKPELSDDVTRPTPCTLVRRMPVNTVNQTESHIDLEILPEIIKMEPPDEGCPSTSFSAQTTTRAPRHPKMTPAPAQTVPSAHQTVPSDHQTDLTDYQTASGPVKRLAPNLSRGSVMAKKGRPKIFQLDT